MRKLMAVSCLIVLLGIGDAAMAQSPPDIPDLSPSWADFLTYTGSDPLTLLVFPSGEGPSFAEARLPDGTFVDGTIVLYVLDGNSDPVANYPREDLWLASADHGMVPCIAGTIADAHTDSDGMTYWSASLRAGGWSEALMQVLINGDALWTGPGLPLKINSPDITADGVVNLADVGTFSGDYHGGSYLFRSDFNNDGSLSLSDVSLLATAIGVGCP